MNTLDRIKKEIAEEYFWDDFGDAIANEPEYQLEDMINEVAKRYAKECCKVSLEEASKHKIRAITSPENIIIL